MNKTPEFVANSEDGVHCANAVFRMVFKHYFDKNFSWEEIDSLTRAEPGKGIWSFIAETELAKRGLKVRNIEPIDYEKLHKEGVSYLASLVSKETYDYYLNETNLPSVLDAIPEFLKNVLHETSRATLEEIIESLKEGKLVAVELNSRILNKKSGFSLHFVLLYDFDGESFILHDPGLPPNPARKVLLHEFNEAWNYPGANGEVTIFSK